MNQAKLNPRKVDKLWPFVFRFECLFCDTLRALTTHRGKRAYPCYMYQQHTGAVHWFSANASIITKRTSISRVASFQILARTARKNTEDHSQDEIAFTCAESESGRPDPCHGFSADTCFCVTSLKYMHPINPARPEHSTRLAGCFCCRYEILNPFTDPKCQM